MLALLIKRYERNFDFDDIKSILSTTILFYQFILKKKNVEITLRYRSH